MEEFKFFSSLTIGIMRIEKFRAGIERPVCRGKCGGVMNSG